MRSIAVLVGALVVAVAALVSLEAAGAILFGWTLFLGRVIPQITTDTPSLVLGVVAVGLFAAGVHWLGRAWCRKNLSNASPRHWSLCSTGTVVLGVVVLFAAGISIVGIVHQTGWLLADRQPLQQEGLGRRADPEANLRTIGLGFDNYSDTYGCLPPSGTYSNNGEMRHSWETHLLDFMGYSTGEIDKDRAWNDPVNERYFKSVIPQFINPYYRTPPLTDTQGFGLSHFAANNRVLHANKSMRIEDISDGTENTILVGEVNGRFQPWGHPVNARDPAKGINRSPSGFGGPPGSGGARFLVADGSVRFVSARVNPEVLKALSTPASGDDPGTDWSRR